MVVDLSRQIGVPANLKTGKNQHKELARQLKKKIYYSIPSMNKGFLVLRKVVGKDKIVTYRNFLYETKPNVKKIMITKV